MAESKVVEQHTSIGTRLKRWIVPGLIFMMALAIVMVILGNWNSWASEKPLQETDDAYTRADMTPLSTKVAGLVAKVTVSDYQSVKTGDLVVQLRDDDFRAQVQQAEAGVASGEAALVNNQRQKELQDARIVQAGENIRASEAQIKAADAGIVAAQSAIGEHARSAVEGAKADTQRTQLERRRREALIATESATHQKVEQVVAEQKRYESTLASREADLASATAQLASREADLARARAQLGGSAAELEAQKRQRAVLDSQELLLRADLNSKRAGLSLATTNLDYTRILAPEDGIVSERKVRAGQLVSPGNPGDLAGCSAIFGCRRTTRKRSSVTFALATRPKSGSTPFRESPSAAKSIRSHPPAGRNFALLPPDNATGNFTENCPACSRENCPAAGTKRTRPAAP